MSDAYPGAALGAPPPEPKSEPMSVWDFWYIPGLIEMLDRAAARIRDGHS